MTPLLYIIVTPLTTLFAEFAVGPLLQLEWLYSTILYYVSGPLTW